MTPFAQVCKTVFAHEAPCPSSGPHHGNPRGDLSFRRPGDFFTMKQEELKRERERLGLSRAELARRAHLVDASHLRKIEELEVEPRLGTWERIQAALQAAFVERWGAPSV